MRTFLFEQYGYYPKLLANNEFIIENYMFKLIDTNLNEENIKEMENHIDVLKSEFNNIGPFIIKNKSDKYISSLLNDKYLLISTRVLSMNLKDLYKFHNMFFQGNEYVEIDKTLAIWKERVEKIEKNINQYLRVDSLNYKDNLNKSMFAIGLAINAMQYLSDIINDYSNRLYGICIVHKRLKDLNSFDFFNPLNFIVDTPCKDIAMLYQNDIIDVNELKYITELYNLNVEGVSFLMARILYRYDVFDYLERKKDIDSNDNVNFDIEKELLKIKKAYSLFKNNFNIRPIEWLEN